ncbi:Ig-like domain-containing protein [Pseudoduganella namucuonensis]|uniref:Ig-like domain-containing protein n=1 Tax=Pseudoduganella namucuonensis TaxID=1035707 RepID=A0A1I7ET67_9BURK|nr:Ig-like domain-containing protein [Pseudoduganella namucuonensis]SFU27137.1 Ig-like domain-containing protein [Pseudoduganella namucuonensis]
MPTVDQTAPTLASSTTGTIAAGANIVLTFSEAIAAGSGNIVITDGATQTYMSSGGVLRTRVVGATDTRTISITDPQVTIDGNTVTINLTGDLKAGVKYSVQMATGVLRDLTGNSYKGLADSTKLAFTTEAAAAPTATVNSAIGMTDTGVLATDYITNATSQVFSGSYSGTLGAGEMVQVSLDGGASWQQAAVSGNSWSYSTTIADSGTVMARVANAAGLSTSAQSHGFVLDTAAPAVPAIALASDSLAAGQTTTVTVTFAEKVTGLEAADFTVTGGALGDFTSADGGLTWTATLTPTAGAGANSAGGIALAAGGVADLAGNTGPAAASSAKSFSYNVLGAPDAAVGGAIHFIDSGSSATDYITNTAAQTVTGTYTGTLAAGESVEVSLDGGTTWHTAGATAGAWSYSGTIGASDTIVARVTNGTLHSASASQTYVYDATTPTFTTTLSDTSLKAGETATITITFSEAVVGLETSDFSVSGCTISSLGSNDGGVTWTATVTPTANASGSGSVTLSGAVATDLAGNGATGAQVCNFDYDTAAPATPTIELSDAVLGSGETATVTVTFAEKVTGLAATDFTISNGTLGTFTSVDQGITWTATLTPATGIGEGSITLNSGTVSDLAGNTGPAAASSAIGFSYNAPAAPTAVVTNLHFFNQASGVSPYYTNSSSQQIGGTYDGTLASGESIEVSVDNGVSWGTATLLANNFFQFTPTISNSGTLIARVTNGDTSTTPVSHSYTYDTTLPTLLNVVFGDDSLKAGQTTQVTFTFSEQLSDGFTPAFSQAHGTLGDLQTSDHITWTATLTPEAGYTGAAGLVLQSGSARDLAGNVAESSTHNFTVDTVAPAPALTISDNTLATGGTATVTLSFAEPITDTPVASDFTVVGGTLGAFTTSNEGFTWTATLTPTSGATGSGSVTLQAGSISDQAGNTGPASATAVTFDYDTQTPSLTADTLDISADTGELATDFVTKTASQTVTGSFSGTVYAPTGAKIEVSADGSNWTLATVDNDTHTFSATGVTLSSGTGTLQARLTDSSGATSTQSHSYTLDTTAPPSPTGVTFELYGGSDSGESGDDGVTNDSAPTFLLNVHSAGLAADTVMRIYDVTTGTSVGTHTLSAAEAAEVNFTMQISALTAGTHVLELRAEDLAGNSSSGASVTVIEDYTGPTLTPTSMTEGDTISAETTTITLTASEYLAIDDTHGFSLSNGSDTRTIAFGSGPGDYASFDSGTNLVTITLGDALEHGSDYTLSVHGSPLLDKAGNTLAVDTEVLHFSTLSTVSAPSAYVSSYPSFFGSGAAINTITGALSAALEAGESVQYTVNGGSSWSTGSTSGSTWTLNSVTLSGGGAIGLRVVDGSGNVGGNEELGVASGYTVYLGDGYGGSLDADTMRYLHAGDGSDTISTTGDADGYLDGGGDGDTFTIGGDVTGAIDGGDGNDTISISAIPTGSGMVDGGGDTDTLLFNASGQSYDLSSAVAYLSSFETISMGSGNTLSVSAAAAAALTSTGVLTIDGGAGNTLNLDTSWAELGADGGYASYFNASHEVTLEVATSLTTNLGTSGLAAPTLTLDEDTANASDGDSGTDHVTGNNSLTVGDVTAAHWRYSTNGGGSWTVGSGSTIGLGDGTYAAGTILVQQYNSVGNESGSGTLGYALTVDSTDPGSLASISPTLYGGSDSGAEPDDLITNDMAPTLSINLAGASLEDGDTLQVYDLSTSTVVGLHTVAASEVASGASAFTMQIDALEAGSHQLVLRAEDLAGNTGVHSATPLAFTLDDTAPELSASSIAPNETVDYDTRSLTLTFSEALDISSVNGFSVTNGSDTHEIVFESGDPDEYLSYNADTHTVTIQLGENLWSGYTYEVKIFSSSLGDLAGNYLEVETTLFSFSVDEQPVLAPNAPSISFTDTSYATGSGSGSDLVTSNASIAVADLYSTYWDYSTDGGTHWTTITRGSGSTGSFTAPDGEYADGDILVRQYDDTDHYSNGAQFGTAVTIDTTEPTGYVSSYPSFEGTGSPIATISGSLSAALGSGEYVEYTLNGGGSWSQASVSGATWTVSGATVSSGGAIGLRVTDTAGNIGSHGDDAAGYTVYIGDGYGGTFDAATMPHLRAGAGNDTINTAGNADGYLDGGGDSDTFTVSGSVSGTIDGGAGNDTLTITGATSGTIHGSGGVDAITLNGAVSGDIDGGDGADTILVYATLEAAGGIIGGEGDDIVTVFSLMSGAMTGGAGNDLLNVDGVTAGSIDGGDGNDQMTLTNTVSGIVDSGGDNDILTIAGVVTGNVSGGGGDDTIGLAAIPTGSVGGGSGTDTLIFNTTSQDITLSTLLTHLFSFEKLALGNSNTLRVGASDITTLSSGYAEITGSTGAHLYLSGQWVEVDVVDADYDTYALGSATVRVQTAAGLAVHLDTA